jgi:GTP-binding protein HflX
MADRDTERRSRLSAVAPPPQRALLVAVDTGDRSAPLAPEFAEFAALARATGVEIVGEVIQKLPHVDPAMLIGSGKAAEVAALAKERGADVLMVFNDLRPRQRGNLEKVVPLPIVDRTMLILDIFAQHARSREGQLQVELAQLRYRQSHLIGSSTALSRLGGGVGTRGPGETKLEVDRRKIAARVTLLTRQLDDVRKQRETRRSGGGRDPYVALVGYTNVGKSSLLNRLTVAPRVPRRGAQHPPRRYGRLHHRAAEGADERLPRHARRARHRRRARARDRRVESRLAAAARERRGDPR